MKQTMEILERHLQQMLGDIAGHLEHDGGFRSPQQLDDVKDCLHSLQIIKQISSQIPAIK